MSSPAVLVHAQLPTVKPSDPRYSDASTWVWVPCLEFPVERVNQLQFSSKPLKWIRYCIGTVTGAQGHLSRKADSLDIIDYDQPLAFESESTLLYYHRREEERRLLIVCSPPSLAATTTSSVACEAFHQDLRDRDTNCVVSASEEVFCDAVHLVPHCRDDDVRTWYTYAPGRAEDIVSSIDDVRNGLLLRAGFHKIMRQTLAFLPVPNFAMDSSDTVLGAHPSEHMYIVHPFIPLKSYHIAGSSSTLAMPDCDTSDQRWPLPVLFEAVYSAVVLHEFGVHAARARVAEVWQDLYYPRGGFDATAAEIDVGRRRARMQRAEVRGPPGPDHFDFLMMFQYLAVPPDELRRYFADVERKAEEAEQRSVEEKVHRWREDV
ncbi:hypothetical protein LXA43DRAFT_1143447, partial [Ganoderma leucocontextum]